MPHVLSPEIFQQTQKQFIAGQLKKRLMESEVVRVVESPQYLAGHFQGILELQFAEDVLNEVRTTGMKGDDLKIAAVEHILHQIPVWAVKDAIKRYKEERGN